MKQRFQGCSFLAACPSEQTRLGCDRRGPDSLGMKTWEPHEVYRGEEQLVSVGMEK